MKITFKNECILFTITDNTNLMPVFARNKYIVKVSMVKYTQLNACLANKILRSRDECKNPRYSEIFQAVATLTIYSFDIYSLGSIIQFN